MTQDAGMDVSPSWQELHDENERLRRKLHQVLGDVQRAREYAGDNLPAAAGHTMVTMLEKATRGGE